jgi:hypothetical protein
MENRSSIVVSFDVLARECKPAKMECGFCENGIYSVLRYSNLHIAFFGLLLRCITLQHTILCTILLVRLARVAREEQGRMKTSDEQTQVGQDWIALIEAESLTGYHPKYIKQLVAAGKVLATGGGRGRGHNVRVSRSSLLGYKARMDARASLPTRAALDSPANMLSAFLAPSSPELAAPRPDENGYTKSRIWLTDSLDAVLDLMEMPCVCVMRKTDVRKVGEMVRHAKVPQVFSSAQAAASVSRVLGIEVVNNAQPRSIRNGDSVIIARVDSSELGFAPKVGFVLAQALG